MFVYDDRAGEIFPYSIQKPGILYFAADKHGKMQGSGSDALSVLTADAVQGKVHASGYLTRGMCRMDAHLYPPGASSAGIKEKEVLP